jgi:sodium/bile acid cotransporter 7
VLFPLLLLAVKPLFRQDDHQLLWMGSFFLAALPSTVSSSVVMVSIAEGNIPAAIFNATISSIAGIFITPLWIEVATGNSSSQMDMSDIMIKLFLQILVPVIIGLLLNPLLGKLAEKYNKQLKYFDQLTILAIVYTAFSESFHQHMFSNINLGELLVLGICMAALFFIINFLLLYISRLLHFSREDTITARFCGSKKSLVHGTVMAKVIFMNSPVMGILLLPVMVYHALQLIAVSIMARNMAKKHQANRSNAD